MDTAATHRNTQDLCKQINERTILYGLHGRNVNSVTVKLVALNIKIYRGLSQVTELD